MSNILTTLSPLQGHEQVLPVHDDVSDLSEGMSYKNALAALNPGG